MKELLHVYRLIPTIAEAVQYLYQQVQGGKAEECLYLVSNVNEAALTIHQALSVKYPAMELPAALTEEQLSGADRLDESCRLLEQLHGWLARSDEICSGLILGGQPPSLRHQMDAQFLSLIDKIKEASYDKILYHISKKFQKLPSPVQQDLEDYFQRFGFWGTLNPARKDFTVFENRARALADHWQDFLWLYQRLHDYRSRFTLLAFVSNWYEFDFTLLGNAKENIYHDYFDLDVIHCDSNEVMVDLGAFVGDTVANYVRTYRDGYKRIYCYEITPNTFITLQNNLRNLQNIMYRQKGASDREGVMYISENSDTSANILSESGLIEVKTTTIDKDIEEPVTLIKMDIEGSEQRALLGCAGHIRNEKPKLAISVYHNNEDIWKIARMVEEICPGYRFYLRYHGGNMVPTEMTLLAVFPS